MSDPVPALRLTPIERRILACLLDRPGEWVSRSIVETEVWPRQPYRSENLLDVHLGRLRAKMIERFGAGVIASSRGVGWTIDRDRHDALAAQALN